MAVAGGVNFILDPETFVHLSSARMASPTGKCHTFSENADGYVRGEGCGIVILKRLEDVNRSLSCLSTQVILSLALGNLRLLYFNTQFVVHEKT